MTKFEIEGWEQVEWEEWKAESERMYICSGGIAYYFKRIPSPVAKNATTERNLKCLTSLKNCTHSCCSHNETNNCQKDFAGENMEEKKEVKWWFNNPNMSNKEDNFRGLPPFMVKGLFDAYHAQKAELQRVKEKLEVAHLMLNGEIELRTQNQSKQPAESEGEWEIREAIPWIVDATHEYRKVIQRRLKPSPKADSDDGNLANEKRTTYHQQRRIPSPQAAEMPVEIRNNYDIAVDCLGKAVSPDWYDCFLKLLNEVDNKIKEARV